MRVENLVEVVVTLEVEDLDAAEERTKALLKSLASTEGERVDIHVVDVLDQQILDEEDE